MGQPRRDGRREHLSRGTAIGLAALIRDKRGPCQAHLPRRPPPATHTLANPRGTKKVGQRTVSSAIRGEGVPRRSD